MPSKKWAVVEKWANSWDLLLLCRTLLLLLLASGCTYCFLAAQMMSRVPVESLMAMRISCKVLNPSGHSPSEILFKVWSHYQVCLYWYFLYWLLYSYVHLEGSPGEKFLYINLFIPPMVSAFKHCRAAQGHSSWQNR